MYSWEELIGKIREIVDSSENDQRFWHKNQTTMNSAILPDFYMMQKTIFLTLCCKKNQGKTGISKKNEENLTAMSVSG